MLTFSGEELEILLEISVHTLSLFICLWMMSHGELRFDVQLGT